jgi:hypothetical protein
MLPPLATDTDLVTWLGHEVNVPRAVAILNASSTLIRNHTGRVWVDEDGVTEDGVSDLHLEGVRLVCLSVAARVYTNPNGKSQSTSGPFSWSVAAWAAMGLALTDEEKAQLPGQVGAVQGLSSIRVQAPWAARGSRRYCEDTGEHLL